MSKIISNKVYTSYLPDNKQAVSFIVENKYAADRFVAELENIDLIEVSGKPFSKSRTLRQNRYLWKLIELISYKINGERTRESTEKIYADLLLEAQVKRDLIAIRQEGIGLLKTQFRAVIPTGQVISTLNEETGKTAKLVSVWVYYGSSTFNTKEMGELLEITIAYAGQLGIHDSEIESMRREYE